MGSAKILGRDDIGSLEVGKAGDLFALDTRRLEMVGADLDPKSLLGTVGWKGRWITPWSTARSRSATENW